MITITLAQIQATGFQLVFGAGKRLQFWSGKNAQSESVMYAWDSVSHRAIQVEGFDTKTYAILGLALMCIDLINLQSISAGAKTAAINQVLDLIIPL